VEWLRAREVELREQLWKQEVRAGARANEAASGDQLEVTEADIAEVIATWSGIPVARVSSQESERLLQLEAELHASVIGQDEAVRCVSGALRRARAGLRDPARPIAGLMFCGPTGVGKTALCKTLASGYFGSDKSMIRLDMSEFMEKHTVSKLIGAPPGYVGYSEGGTLTEAIRQRPYSLVLFDEVEKAHPDVFNTMLQLLDDGRLTDSRGRTVSFANSLIIMTSNVGSRQVQRGVTGGGALGFDAADDAKDARGSNYSRVQSLVMDELKGLFRPEFLNRLDEVVVFQALTRDNVRKIADVEFPRVLNRLGDRGIKVNLTENFKRKVVSEGFDPAYGARPLRRAIAKLLEDPLAEHLLAMERDGRMPTRSGESEEKESASPGAASQAPVKDTNTITVDVDDDGQVSVSDCGEDAATVGVPSTR
jgi:ATP-dependent Clp protease ATP-binding subunit ClpC